MESCRGSVTVVDETETIRFPEDETGPEANSTKGWKSGGKPSAMRALSSAGSCGTGAGGRPVVE